MYKILKINKENNHYEILVKNKILKTKHWLIAKYDSKKKDFIFDWKEIEFDLTKKNDIIKLLVQSNEDEFIDATASAICQLEKDKFITVSEDFEIEEVK